MPLPPETTPTPTTVLAPGTSPAVEAAAGKPEDKDAPDEAVHHEFPLPKLRLEVRDLKHPGSHIVLHAVQIDDVVATAARNVLQWLYHLPVSSSSASTPPGTRSVTLIVRDMDGVAYTTGSDLDNDHKEVHLSARYVAGVSPATRQGDEVVGVVTHEMVHCLQHNGHGTCPGGLIEGVADWVRLRCGLQPPHWKRDPVAAGKWDAGYQHTAYFLDYLEGRFGEGTVRRINGKLRLQRYVEDTFWTELLGGTVGKLWEDYVKEHGNKGNKQ